MLSSFEIRYIRFFLSCKTARNVQDPRLTLLSTGKVFSTTAACLEEEVLDISAVHARKLGHLLA